MKKHVPIEYRVEEVPFERILEICKDKDWQRTVYDLISFQDNRPVHMRISKENYIKEVPVLPESKKNPILKGKNAMPIYRDVEQGENYLLNILYRLPGEEQVNEIYREIHLRKETPVEIVYLP